MKVLQSCTGLGGLWGVLIEHVNECGISSIKTLPYYPDCFV